MLIAGNQIQEPARLTLLNPQLSSLAAFMKSFWVFPLCLDSFLSWKHLSSVLDGLIREIHLLGLLCRVEQESLGTVGPILVYFATCKKISMKT